jgi:hypothetical protein
MKLEDIYVVSQKRRSVAGEEISTMESSLKVNLPDDLRDFLVQLGSGEFCGCLFFFNPTAMVEGQKMFKEMTRESFYYDRAKSALTADSLDIHHDLDFDGEVARIADLRFRPLGFRVVEHFSPKKGRE